VDSFKPGDFGVSIFYGQRPVKKPCENCPFVAAAAGADYLARGRLDGIKFAVSMGQLFACHKTVYQKGVEFIADKETGEEHAPGFHSKYQACAGATEYAEALAEELGVEPLRCGSPPTRRRKGPSRLRKPEAEQSLPKGR